jgi:hypothetical protein
MKTTKLLKSICFLIVLIALVMVPAARAAETNRPVTVLWDYPANELTNVTFYVYQSTNITTPLTNWIVLTNVTGVTTAKISVLPGVNHFAVSASNFWGRSFSGVASTPPQPRSDVTLSVQRAD